MDGNNDLAINHASEAASMSICVYVSIICLVGCVRLFVCQTIRMCFACMLRTYSHVTPSAHSMFAITARDGKMTENMYICVDISLFFCVNM